MARRAGLADAEGSGEEDVLVGRRLGVALGEPIENAVKHSDGEPTIEIAVEVDDEREQAWVKIMDEGPGVPEQELEVTRSGGETPLTHGSGIGLLVGLPGDR